VGKINSSSSSARHDLLLGLIRRDGLYSERRIRDVIPDHCGTLSSRYSLSCFLGVHPGLIWLLSFGFHFVPSCFVLPSVGVLAVWCDTNTHKSSKRHSELVAIAKKPAPFVHSFIHLFIHSIQFNSDRIAHNSINQHYIKTETARTENRNKYQKHKRMQLEIPICFCAFSGN